MAGPSQPQVTDEVWDDERIKSFLNLKPVADESADFHILLKAYRGMRADDFGRFLRVFSDAGRDLEATDHTGRTIWKIIGEHRLGRDFLNAKQRLSQ